MQAGVGHENYSHMGGANGECPTFDTIIEESPTLYDSNTASYVTKAIRVDFSGAKRRFAQVARAGMPPAMP